MVPKALIRKAYAVQLTYNTTDVEKAQAEKGLLAFNYLLKLLRISTDHLNIMYTPFKDHSDIAPEEIVKFRAALRRFRDKVIDNFNNFKIAAFKCITLMQLFSSDTQISKLIKSFITSVEDVEKQVNTFAALFDDLEAKDFVAKSVASLEAILKETDQLEDIINERIKTHIQTNILGKTWVDSISDELQIDVEQHTPLLLELNQKQQQELGQLKGK